MIDNVNQPKHYCRPGAMETIDEMLALFGKDEVMSFCKLNAWKYRARAMYKNKDEDMAKSDWYIKKYQELKRGCKRKMTNREYLIKSLSEPDWIDDGGADYESLLNYNINCPYFSGDDRCHCKGLKGTEQPSRFDDCYFCKEEWLDSEVDG